MELCVLFDLPQEQEPRVIGCHRNYDCTEMDERTDLVAT